MPTTYLRLVVQNWPIPAVNRRLEIWLTLSGTVTSNAVVLPVAVD